MRSMLEQIEYIKRWQKENPEKVKGYNKKWYQKNKDYHTKWYQENKEKIIERMKKRHQDNKEHYNKYHKKYQQKKYKTDISFRINRIISVNIRNALKERKAGRHWEKLVGYTLQILMAYLENRFDENMTWNNYGSYWEIDHCKPKSLFNYTYPKDPEFKKCWALDNLRPLEKSKNREKHSKFII